MSSKDLFRRLVITRPETHQMRDGSKIQCDDTTRNTIDSTLVLSRIFYGSESTCINFRFDSSEFSINLHVTECHIKPESQKDPALRIFNEDDSVHAVLQVVIG